MLKNTTIPAYEVYVIIEKWIGNINSTSQESSTASWTSNYENMDQFMGRTHIATILVHWTFILRMPAYVNSVFEKQCFYVEKSYCPILDILESHILLFYLSSWSILIR